MSNEIKYTTDLYYFCKPNADGIIIKNYDPYSEVFYSWSEIQGLDRLINFRWWRELPGRLQIIFKNSKTIAVGNYKFFDLFRIYSECKKFKENSDDTHIP